MCEELNISGFLTNQSFQFHLDKVAVITGKHWGEKDPVQIVMQIATVLMQIATVYISCTWSIFLIVIYSTLLDVKNWDTAPTTEWNSESSCQNCWLCGRAGLYPTGNTSPHWDQPVMMCSTDISVKLQRPYPAVCSRENSLQSQVTVHTSWILVCACDQPNMIEESTPKCHQVPLHRWK